MEDIQSKIRKYIIKSCPVGETKDVFVGTIFYFLFFLYISIFFFYKNRFGETFPKL